MKHITQHPLYAAAEIVKRAFIVNGFEIFRDDNETPELLPNEKNTLPFEYPQDFSPSPIMIKGGQFSMRVGLLVSELPGIRSSLPLRKVVCGKIYDAKDETLPNRLRIEGILSDETLTFKGYLNFWNRIATAIYGVDACAQLEPLGKDTYHIVILSGEKSITVGCTGVSNWMTTAILGLEGGDTKIWAFSLDVDIIALDMFGIKGRAELYSNHWDLLDSNTDSSAAVTNNFASRASDLLRKMGFRRFTGMRFYPEDIYVKMNMIQESWDKNNQAVLLEHPIDGKVGLPTVLTPSAEQALSDCFCCGAEDVRIFDLGHIFLPGENGKAPIEKTAIAIYAYGPEVTSKSFRNTITSFLKEMGVRNHFLFPTDMAIAYDTKDTWVLLDEKMNYLEGNLGGICKKAEDNFGIGVHAFMANFELETIEAKSLEEYAFTPPETL